MSWRIYAAAVLGHSMLWTGLYTRAIITGEIDKPLAPGEPTTDAVLLLSVILVSNVVLAWRALLLERQQR